jgi:hypothetical protein
MILKGEHLFYNREIKFSGKVKFLSNSPGQFTTRADYSLQQKPYEESKYNFTHRSSGETTLDSYWLLGSPGRYKLQLYKKISVTLTEKERKGDIKLHLRNIFNNGIFSVLIEK